MQLEIKNGRYSLITDALSAISNARIILRFNGQVYSCLDGAVAAGEHAYVTDVLDGKLQVHMIFALTDRLLVKITVENLSEEAVILERCYPMQAEVDMNCDPQDIHVQCYSGHTMHSEVRSLTASADPSRYGESITTFPFEDGKHRSVFIGNMYNTKADSLLNLSFMTFDRIYGFIQYYVENGQVKAESYCDFLNYSLAPGQILEMETFRIAASFDKDACLSGWAADVRAHYQPKFSFRPALGITSFGNTWQADTSRYEELARRNYQAVQKRLRGFGVEYQWISINNLKDELPGNWLLDNEYRIPSGLAKLAVDMKENGIKLGLWMAPFWVPDRGSSQAEEQADLLLRQDGKRTFYEKGWNFITEERPYAERASFYCLDGSHPESLKYIRQVFEAYRKIGVRYYMIDFLRSGAGRLAGPYGYNEYYDKTMVNGPEVFRKMLEAVRQGAGEDTYLLAASGPTIMTTGYVDATRIGADIGEGRMPKPDSAFYPATAGLKHKKPFYNNINHYAHSYFCDNALYHLDGSNVISVDKPISISQAQIVLSMAALTASPMMLGDRLWDISEERLAMLKKALPQNAGEHAVPLDFMKCVYPEIPGVFCLKVNRSWGSYSVVGLVNISGEERSFTLDFKELGFEGNCVVYDFWDENCLGIHLNLSQNLAPWTVKVLRIAALEDKPQLLSTDMHVLQGAVEIKNIDWRNNELAVAVTRPTGEKGTVSLLVPVRYVPVSSYMNFHSARMMGTDYYIISGQLEFDTDVKVFNVKFAVRQ